jgi:hypothetical protein
MSLLRGVHGVMITLPFASSRSIPCSAWWYLDGDRRDQRPAVNKIKIMNLPVDEK